MRYLYIRAFHFWVHALRFLTTVATLVMTTWLAVWLPTLARWAQGATLESSPDVRELYVRSMLTCIILFVFLIPLLLNDSLMLTFDYYRTDTYFGSVVVQTGVSVAALALASTVLGIWSPLNDLDPFRWWIVRWRLIWPILLGCIMLWSFSLIGALCWAALLPPRRINSKQMWKYNTKDVLWGATARDNHIKVASLPSITGRPRDIHASGKQGPSPVMDPIRRFTTRVLFRRVSSAESKSHALPRNLFALLAIFLIVFRATVALAQANNKVETRLQSKPCNKPSIMYDTRILMTDMSGTIQDSNEVSTVNMTTADWGAQGCITTYLGLEHRAKPNGLGEPKFTRYNMFSCLTRLGHSDLPLSFDITVRSFNESGLRVDPLLWVLNEEDLDDSRKPSVTSIMKGGAPAYIPAWQLRHGYHIEGEVRIVKRRVITSSVWRDLLINLDPQYTAIWLYQITTTSATRPANGTVASARLHMSFDPSLNFLGGEKAIWNSEDGLLSTSPPEVCDIIEDYRSSTVMDVIGSVGGLFALLQAAHILLFGQPLLWGLTGAKLITPFGLLGACSSKGFKRRLREQYHRQPTNDSSDPIQLGAFLRDFVIDFGPAGVDEAQPESRITPEPDPGSEEDDRNGSAGVHV